MSRPLGIGIRRAITIPPSGLPSRNPYRTRRVILSCLVHPGAQELPEAQITNVSDTKIEITSPAPHNNHVMFEALASALKTDKSKFQIVTGWRGLEKTISMPLMALGMTTIREATERSTNESTQAPEDKLVQLIKNRLQSSEVRWKGRVKVEKKNMLKAAGEKIGRAKLAARKNGGWRSKNENKKAIRKNHSKKDLKNDDFQGPEPLSAWDTYLFY